MLKFNGSTDCVTARRFRYHCCERYPITILPMLRPSQPLNQCCAMYAFGQRVSIYLATLVVASTGCALSKTNKATDSLTNAPNSSPVVLATGVNAGIGTPSQIQPAAATETVDAQSHAIVKRAPSSAVNSDQVLAEASRQGSDLLSGFYLIEPGDNLEVKFRSTSELDEQVTVRPDGMISLPIVGDVAAAGITPEILRQTLMSRYSGELKSPDITVIVRSFSGNNIYVGGEVFAPGRVALVGRVTALNAIILAGGFKDTADQKRVIVRRSDGSCCAYDLKSVIECKGGHDIRLQPYDVVYVPKSHIAKVNQFVEQYIDKVLPFSRSVGIFVSPNTGMTSAVGSP